MYKKTSAVLEPAQLAASYGLPNFERFAHACALWPLDSSGVADGYCLAREPNVYQFFILEHALRLGIHLVSLDLR